MKYERVIVELHPALLKSVFAVASEQEETVSEWLAEAAARVLPEPEASRWRMEAAKAAIEDFEAEFGRITEVEM